MQNESFTVSTTVYTNSARIEYNRYGGSINLYSVYRYGDYVGVVDAKTIAPIIFAEWRSAGDTVLTTV
jgi:hypothetical protein